MVLHFCRARHRSIPKRAIFSGRAVRRAGNARARVDAALPRSGRHIAGQAREVQCLLRAGAVALRRVQCGLCALFPGRVAGAHLHARAGLARTIRYRGRWRGDAVRPVVGRSALIAVLSWMLSDFRIWHSQALEIVVARPSVLFVLR